ncbi:uncharacterized protein [Watersipora subatra]|uniref:uncharacterized protein n=1 Tax=Watersipora subatra TaxID=2589382 RepID=UPI00355AE068
MLALEVIYLSMITTMALASRHRNPDLSHLDKPICRDSTKWRYVAEHSVMPEENHIIYVSDEYPHLYRTTPGPSNTSQPEGIPEYERIYREKCAYICLTHQEFQCRFVAFIYPFVCLLAKHTNEFDTNKAFDNPFLEVPRVCLPNDGCQMVGEYFADSFSRCHFYQCSPAGRNALKATQHRCPDSTLTRDNFLTSRNDQYFTQPCSQFGRECLRPFPLFAP